MTKKKPKQCPYWVWCKDSNVHVAGSQHWFTDYTPFKSSVLRQSGKKVAVVGIGTVYLSMRRALCDDTPFAFDIFKMDNVLHVPSAPGNIIGGPLDGMKIKYDISPAGRKTTAIVNQSTGSIFGYFHPGWEDLRLLRVAVGIKQQCTAEEGSAWLARISEEMTVYTWPVEARALWEKKKDMKKYMHPNVAAAAASSVYSSIYPPMTPSEAATSSSTEASLGFTLVKSAASTAPKPAHSEGPLTSEEKAWLRKHFGTEYAFLKEHGLYIHVERDRDSGRCILRAMIASGCMSDEEPDTEQDQAQSASMTSGSVTEAGGDPEQLNREERLWVRKHFGSEYNFLKESNLYIHVAHQRREGWRIIRSMIASGCMSDYDCSGSESGEEDASEPSRMADEGLPQAVLAKAMDRMAITTKHHPDDENNSVEGCYAVQQYQEQAETANQYTHRPQTLDDRSDGGADDYGQDGTESPASSPAGKDDAYYMDQWPVADGVRVTVATRATASKPHQWQEYSLLD
ncbi:signal sequence receptor alpha subunit [Ophiostoma piceae UAMH 11346]|uniref:Signal sequence receptor alpha subunit n=1 Tax=Ophiostoma piceae (strain UAMH 11346) TaxID=1262450 RepID=S3BW58_OPHP1|nr:signal sequence receptor alpha subunit [Ophiostoma piceae UAMH 11346]